MVAEYDVRLDYTTCARKINVHPHGLGVGADGVTIWYTGKATGTLGKITPDGRVETFALATVGSVPIYIKAGPEGHMWFTELVGNAIGRIGKEILTAKPSDISGGSFTFYEVPTRDTVMHRVILGPDGNLWFTELMADKLGKVSLIN